MQKKPAQKGISRTHRVLPIANDAVRISYDREADAAYFELSPAHKGAAIRAIELTDWLIANLDTSGKLLGIEMLFVSSKLPKARMRELQAAAI